MGAAEITKQSQRVEQHCAAQLGPSAFPENLLYFFSRASPLFLCEQVLLLSAACCGGRDELHYLHALPAVGSGTLLASRLRADAEVSLTCICRCEELCAGKPA